MQLEWDEHFFEIVLPAWQDYLSAADELAAAAQDVNEARQKNASYKALRFGSSSALFLHHFADIVLRARPPFLPKAVRNIADLQTWLAGYCTSLRTGGPIGDVALLGDVADALKHAVLTRRLALRDIAANDAVLVVAIGFAELRFSEGNYGGTDRVVVRANSGARALSAVLQNVIDAWRRAADMPLPDVGEA